MNPDFVDPERGVVTVKVSPLSDPDEPDIVSLHEGKVTFVRTNTPENGRKTVEAWTLPCPVIVSIRNGIKRTRQLVENTGQLFPPLQWSAGVRYERALWPYLVYEIREEAAEEIRENQLTPNR